MTDPTQPPIEFSPIEGAEYVPNEKDRLIVVNTVYHQPFDGDIAQIDSRYSRWLETQEQPYIRHRLTADTGWKKVDCGWVRTASLLVILNDEGRFSTKPTEQERLEMGKKIIELRHDGDMHSWIIPPGESFRGCPSNLKTLLIRCQSGTARYSLGVFPA